MSTLLEGGVVVEPELTESASVAAWLSEPDVPVKTTLAVPPTAEADAVRFTFWPVPGERVNVDGVAVTPCGRPPIVTCTELLNALAATAVTVTDCVALPAVKAALDGLS